jgi:hypothetical protein
VSNQKCPECGQSVDAESKTAVLNLLLDWDPDPWYDPFLQAAPGTVFNVPVLGEVMVVAVCDPSKYNTQDGYGFQGEEPEAWIVLLIKGRLYRKNGKTDSYCNEYNWSGQFVEVAPNREVKTSWARS